MVGSFSHYDTLLRTREVRRGGPVSELRRADPDLELTYLYDGAPRTLADYVDRNPVTGLLIAKGDTILFEHYQYGRTDRHRFVSQSMAKTVTAMLIGIAVAEGKIASIEDRVERYVPGLAGTEYGGTTLRSLLTMSSGVLFREDYDGADDMARLGRDLFRPESPGPVSAVRQFNTRAAPADSVFYYASSDDFSSSRHPALPLCSSMIFPKTGSHFSGSCSRIARHRLRARSSARDQRRQRDRGPADHQKDAAGRRRHGEQRRAAPDPSSEVAGEKRHADEDRPAAGAGDAGVDEPRPGERREADERGGVDEQEPAGGLEVRAARRMRAGGRKRDPGKAGQSRKRDQETVGDAHVRLVVRFPGKAQGRLARSNRRRRRTLGEGMPSDRRLARSRCFRRDPHTRRRICAGLPSSPLPAPASRRARRPRPARSAARRSGRPSAARSAPSSAAPSAPSPVARLGPRPRRKAAAWRWPRPAAATSMTSSATRRSTAAAARSRHGAERAPPRLETSAKEE